MAVDHERLADLVATELMDELDGAAPTVKLFGVKYFSVLATIIFPVGLTRIVTGGNGLKRVGFLSF